MSSFRYRKANSASKFDKPHIYSNKENTFINWIKKIILTDFLPGYVHVYWTYRRVYKKSTKNIISFKFIKNIRQKTRKGLCEIIIMANIWQKLV